MHAVTPAPEQTRPRAAHAWPACQHTSTRADQAARRTCVASMNRPLAAGREGFHGRSVPRASVAHSSSESSDTPAAAISVAAAAAAFLGWAVRSLCSPATLATSSADMRRAAGKSCAAAQAASACEACSTGCGVPARSAGSMGPRLLLLLSASAGGCWRAVSGAARVVGTDGVLRRLSCGGGGGPKVHSVPE